MKFKFRVWDKMNKTWATDFTLSLDGDLLCDKGARMTEKHPRDTIYTIGLHDKEGIITGYITLQEQWGTTKVNVHTEDDCIHFQIFADELQELNEAIASRLNDMGVGEQSCKS